MTTTGTTRTHSRTRPAGWPASPALALLVLRVAIGAVFIAHGAQKLFVYGFAGTSGSFADMGVPLATVAGPFVGFIEFIGGMLLVVGLLTRIVAALLAVDMLVAGFLVHLPNGIFSTDNGFELPLALVAVAVAIIVAGAGRFSMDGVLAGRR